MIRKKFFSFLATNATTSRGWAVLAIAGLLTIVSLVLLPRLKILTSREGMVSEDLPIQKQYAEYSKEFGTQNQLIILLEGPPEKLRPAVDAVAKALPQDPQWVKTVFHKIDFSTIRKAGLYYLKSGDLNSLQEALDKYEPLLAEAFGSGSWADVLGKIEEESGKVSLNDMKDKEKVDAAFSAVEKLLDQWQQFLDNPKEAKLNVDEVAFGEMAAQQETQIDKDGYLVGNQGRLNIIFVQQAKPVDDTEYILPLMKYCRATVEKTLADYPGVTAGFTGWPVSIEEEINLIQTDLQTVILMSGVVILAIFLLAFRSIHRTILVFLPLIFGVLWNFGITLFTVGHLNYLTSVFVGILFGLGIDYGVVFVSRFDQERALGNDPFQAITNTLMSVGPSVTTGAGTVIAAFFAIGATDQPAFSELGIVAGTGVLCVLVSTLFVFPVLIARFPPKTDPRAAHLRSESLVLRKATQGFLRAPMIVTAVVLIIAVGLATQVPKVGFDYNLNNLLPKDSETVRVAGKLEEYTQYKMQYITVISDTLKQAQELQPLLEKLPTVQRVESISMLIPANQQEKQKRFPAIAAQVEKIKVGTPGEPDMDRLTKQIKAFVEKLELAQEDAFSAGRNDLVGHLEKILGRMEDIAESLAAPNAKAAQAKFEAEFFAALKEGKAEFLSMLAQPPITLDKVPASLRDRFMASTGRFSTYVFPTDEIWDVEFLDKFLAEVEAAGGEVFGPEESKKRLSGFGVVFRTTSRLIRDGFSQASWMAGLVVLVMLLLDFRRLRPVILATVPLFVGAAITLGGMGLLGLNLNLASQISFPILLGIGVDYGILFTRRWLEPDGADLPKVSATIGYAIFLAAATTVAGFGSLIFADHRGLISFGQVLVVAISLCLFAAVILLPALIKALKLDKRSK